MDIDSVTAQSLPRTMDVELDIVKELGNNTHVLNHSDEKAHNVSLFSDIRDALQCQKHSFMILSGYECTWLLLCEIGSWPGNWTWCTPGG